MFFCRRHLSHAIFTESSKRFFAQAATQVGASSATAAHSRRLLRRNDPRAQTQRDSHPAIGLSNFKLALSDILRDKAMPQEERAEQLRSCINSAYFPVLEPPEAMQLVEAYRDVSGGWKSLKLNSFFRLVCKVCPVTSSGTTDPGLLHILHPGILMHLRSFTPPEAAYNYRPWQLVRHLPLYIRQLLRHGLYPQVLEIFEIYLQKEFIQPIPELAATENIPVIVLLTLAKASLQWHWRHNAALLVISAMEGQPYIPEDARPAVDDIVFSVLHHCLQDGRPALLDRCMRLVQILHPTRPLSDPVIKQFYIALKKADQPDMVCDLHFFLNRPDILRSHAYPLPPPETLLWILQSLQRRSAASHLARRLVSHVVQNEITIPVQDRAAFITMAAESGFGVLAKRLWLRYSHGPDRIVVTGDSALMLRMASLFSHIRYTNVNRASSHKSLSSAALLGRAQDAEEFTNKILTEYASAHHPLYNADHQHLTSFARANFMVGRVGYAVKLYKKILDHGFTPDIYDVHVILQSLAQRNPRVAAKMIARMMERGVQPVGLTFGIVLHNALEQGDIAVFLEVLSKAVECGVDLTHKTLVSLVRYNAESAVQAEPSEQLAKFLGVLSVMKGMRNVGLVTSPHLGKFLVYCALDAKQPTIAYRFWDLMLRHTAEWSDKEQVQIRSRLSNRIMELHNRGDLGRGRAEVMLSRLGRRLH